MKRLDCDGTEICYLGLGPEAGPLPALFYFSLSGEESLTLSPYNSPAALLEGAPLRVFSMTIPGHGEDFDKLHAIKYWADQMAEENYILEEFFEKITSSIDWLIENGYVDPDHIAVGGLSRGAFVATHVAALEKRIKIILGFAPLTKLSATEEFSSAERGVRVKVRAATLDLEHLAEKLTHIHNLRFYIGNRDERVSTDACYCFLRKLANTAHEIRARHMNVELNLTQAIGHKGHGTSPQTFEEGTLWVKDHLLGKR